MVSPFRVDELSAQYCHPEPKAKGLVLHMTGPLLTRNEILRRFASQNDTFRIAEHTESEPAFPSTQLGETTYSRLFCEKGGRGDLPFGGVWGKIETQR